MRDLNENALSEHPVKKYDYRLAHIFTALVGFFMLVCVPYYTYLAIFPPLLSESECTEYAGKNRQVGLPLEIKFIDGKCIRKIPISSKFDELNERDLRIIREMSEEYEHNEFLKRKFGEAEQTGETLNPNESVEFHFSTGAVQIPK